MTAPWARGPVTGLRRVAMLCVLAAMESVCILAIIQAVDHQFSLHLNLAVLAAIVPLSLAGGLLLERWRPPRGGRLLPVAVTAVIAAAAASGAVLTHSPGARPAALACAVVFCVVGVRLSLLRVGFATVLGEFQFGLVVLVVALFAGGRLGVQLPFAVVVGPGFVVLGMMGLGLARNGSRVGSSSGRGLWMLVPAGVLAVLVLGAALTALVTPEALSAVGRAFAWLWTRIESIFAAIANWFPEDTSAPAEGPGWSAPGGGGEETVGGQVLPDSALRAVRMGYAVFAGVVAVVVVYLLTARVVAWARVPRAGGGGVRVERLHGAFGADLRWWLARRLRWPARIVSAVFRRHGGEDVETATVRDVYRRALAWAATRGYRRGAAQTPLEFASALALAHPETARHIEMLTRAYIEVRYGSRVPHADEVQSLREALADLRKMDVRREPDGRSTGRDHEHAGA